ncbi:MAG: hypothetical protein DPW14_10795 [Planctomycetes bacterium]|nr:hypothetical protein [Planctomycetota bacterium]
MDFTEWPGRDTQRLGGFAFDPGDYRELDGFKVSGDSIQAIPNGEPPNVLLERYVTFVKTTGQLTVTIRVMASRQWAQRFFLAWIAPPLSGDPTTPVLGKDRGILIGDVCQGSAEDKVQTQGTLFFVRHNVAVKLELLPIRRVEGAPVELNLVALAQKMDGVIRSQSQNASTWEDLEKFRPVIDEFVIVAEKLEQVKGKNRSDVTCVVHHPSGKKISFAHFEEVRGLSVVAKNGRPVDVGIALGGKYDAREYKIWLVVYDDSLLFSIAETSVPVQPQ